MPVLSISARVLVIISSISLVLISKPVKSRSSENLGLFRTILRAVPPLKRS